MIESGDKREAPSQISPVFIFGADHSGTTILYKMLAYHPDLTWFSQFSLRRGEIPGRRQRPIADRLDPVLRSLPHPWRKESTRLRHWLVPQPGEEATIWAYLLEDEESNADRLRSHLAAFSEKHGRRRVLAKRPDFYRHLDFLKAAFPDARFVHIVRDGRPVALSLRAKELTVNAKRGGQPADPEDALLGAARFWVEVLDRADEVPAADLIEVRYEDLCADVHDTIRTILRDVALDIDAFPFRRCPSTLSSRNPHWVTHASAHELAEVSRIQSDQLIRHHYFSRPDSVRNGAP